MKMNSHCKSCFLRLTLPFFWALLSLTFVLWKSTLELFCHVPNLPFPPKKFRLTATYDFEKRGTDLYLFSWENIVWVRVGSTYYTTYSDGGPFLSRYFGDYPQKSAGKKPIVFSTFSDKRNWKGVGKKCQKQRHSFIN